MVDPTHRDHLWDTVIRLLSESDQFTAQDVLDLVEMEMSKRTVQRALYVMRDLGWLEKEKKEGHFWFPGPKAREYLSIEDETE